jgi:hypothetical protein
VNPFPTNARERLQAFNHLRQFFSSKSVRLSTPIPIHSSPGSEMPPWHPEDAYDQSKETVVESQHEVRTSDEWIRLATWMTEPLLCRAVKVVMTQDNTIYFMNTNSSPYHYDFLKTLGLESRCEFF